MSRRKPDTRTPEEKELQAGYRQVEVFCTGRGTHAREFLSRYFVSKVQMQEMLERGLSSYAHDDPTFIECVLAEGHESTHLVEPEGAQPYFTVTWRCTRCGRNIPMKFGEDRRRAIALVAEGASNLDISRLDRVRLP